MDLDIAKGLVRDYAFQLRKKGVSFKSNDNISEYVGLEEMEAIEIVVEHHATKILEALLIDVDADHNTIGTPKRLAKMFCYEIFRGRYEPAPKITDFPNGKHLNEVYTTGPISIRSCCSHHLCPILGKAWIGILPGERVIGLSKFNRLIQWICNRPQIQEELSIQIADELEKVTQPKGLALVIEASHSCMTWRGVEEHPEAVMTTSVMRGVFLDNPTARAEFFSLIKR